MCKIKIILNFSFKTILRQLFESLVYCSVRQLCFKFNQCLYSKFYYKFYMATCSISTLVQRLLVVVVLETFLV